MIESQKHRCIVGVPDAIRVIGQCGSRQDRERDTSRSSDYFYASKELEGL